MTNNSINNNYIYPSSTSTSLKNNTRNISVATTPASFHLPVKSSKNDCIILDIRVSYSGYKSMYIQQNEGQKIIVPYDATTYAIKDETTVGTGGQVQINLRGISEIMLICIEEDTTFLFLNTDGFGISGSVV